MAKEIFNAGGIIARISDDLLEMFCYGQIGQWCDIDDKEFVALMLEYGERDLHIHINSEGGQVTTAMTIRNALAKYSGKITIYIDGIAASAATLITCTKGARVIAKTGSMMMIHSPLFYVGMANANDMKKMIKALDKCQESILSVYQERTGLTSEDLIALMEAETFLSAKDALRYGFIDEIEEAEAQNVDKDVEDKLLGYSRDDYRRAVMAKLQNEVTEEPKKVCGEGEEEEQAGEEVVTEEETEVTTSTTTTEEEVVAPEKTEEEEEEQELSAEEEKVPEEVQNKLIQRGRMLERKRIQALEELAPAGSEKLLFAAKYTNPMNAEKFAVALIKSQKESGKRYLEARSRDAATVSGISVNAPMNKDKVAKDFVAVAKQSFKTAK